MAGDRGRQAINGPAGLLKPFLRICSGLSRPRLWLTRIQQSQNLVGAGADRMADAPKAGRALRQGHDGGIVAEWLNGDERVVILADRADGEALAQLAPQRLRS